MYVTLLAPQRSVPKEIDPFMLAIPSNFKSFSERSLYFIKNSAAESPVGNNLTKREAALMKSVPSATLVSPQYLVALCSVTPLV